MIDRHDTIDAKQRMSDLKAAENTVSSLYHRVTDSPAHWVSSTSGGNGTIGKRKKSPDPGRSAKKLARRNLRWHGEAYNYKDDKVLAEYKVADENRRLQLFLQQPHLRSKLKDIDHSSTSTKLSAEPECRRKSFAAQMGMALGSAAGGGYPVP